MNIVAVPTNGSSLAVRLDLDLAEFQLWQEHPSRSRSGGDVLIEALSNLYDE
jgi:hypothetical protein